MSNILIENAGHFSNTNAKPLHTHSCYEIIYLKRGRLLVTVDGKEYDAIAPSLIFLSKLEQHSLTVKSDVYERYFLCISPAHASSYIRNYTLLTLLSNRHSGFCHVIDASEFESEADRIFSECINEVKVQKPYTAERQAALLSDLLITIYRVNPVLFSTGDDKSISIIWKIQNRFEKEYAEKFSLSKLADEYHMSPYYLSHLFKRVTGYAIMEYLTMCRLSVARELLSNSDKSVTEVVYAAGFSDSSNFSRLFKRETGCSPSEYKNRKETVK